MLGAIANREERVVGLVAHSSFLLTLFNAALNCDDDKPLYDWFPTGERRCVLLEFFQ